MSIREPRQVRKEAALSGIAHVPQGHPGLVRFGCGLEITSKKGAQPFLLHFRTAVTTRNYMTFDDLYKYCMSRKGATNDLPFDETTICFRVRGKIFALTDIKYDPPRVNLKCDPELAIDLREMYTSVIPGYYMNKKHWNTVIIDGSIPDSEIEKMIDHSHSLIVKGLKKSDREDLEKA